jgi:hypothetical protein
VTELIHTASWPNLWEWKKRDLLAVTPVRISVQAPRYWPKAGDLPSIRELAPYGLLKLSGVEFDAAYLAKLAGLEPEAIQKRLHTIQIESGGIPALACFEADREDCHRSAAGRWLEANLPVTVRELESPEDAQLRLGVEP